MSPPLSAGGDSIGKIAAANTEGGVDVVHLVFLRLVTECRAAALRSYAEECHGGRIPRRCAHDGSRGGFENAVAIVVAMRDRGLETAVPRGRLGPPWMLPSEAEAKARRGGKETRLFQRPENLFAA